MAKKFIFVNTDGDYEQGGDTYEQSDFIQTSAGAGDAGKPIRLDSSGHVDGSMIDDVDIDHNNLTNTHNLTTDIDHGTITGGHNLTTDIDHNTISNTHNLTSDINHDTIFGFVANEHIDWTVDANPSDIHTANIPDALLRDGSRSLTNDWTVDGTGTYTIKVAKEPLASTDVVNKEYADAVAGGFGPKRSVRVTTTGNLTATYDNGTSGVGATLTNSGTQAAIEIDTITLAVGERVLVKDQTNAFENGLYTVTTVGDGSTNWVLTRATDFDNSPEGEIKPGDFCPVEEGAVYSGYQFYQVDFTISDAVGTDDITFSYFSNPVNVTAGDGIDLVGNTISVDVTDIIGAGLVETSNNIDIDWSATFADDKAIKASDLNSTANGKGASIIGLEDAGGYTSADNVEAALAEIYTELDSGLMGVNYTVGTGGVTKGDLVYVSSNNTVLPYVTITNAEIVIGVAETTTGAGGTVKVLANDAVIESVISSGTAGTKYYWDGANGWTTSLATFSSGDYIWTGGVAKNATDVHTHVQFIMKKA